MLNARTKADRYAKAGPTGSPSLPSSSTISRPSAVRGHTRFGMIRAAGLPDRCSRACRTTASTSAIAIMSRPDGPHGNRARSAKPTAAPSAASRWGRAVEDQDFGVYLPDLANPCLEAFHRHRQVVHGETEVTWCCPLRGRALGIGIHEVNASPPCRKFAGQMDRHRRFSDTALAPNNGNHSRHSTKIPPYAGAGAPLPPAP